MNLQASNNSLNASGSLRPNYESDSILELQKILTDERKRATEHKLNYQQIKSEMGKLQENYARLVDELQSCEEAKQIGNNELEKKLSQSNKKLVEMQSIIDDLKGNQVTEKRIEMIRLKIEEQFELVYQERISKCLAECESMRAESAKLKSENCFLHSEYEHQNEEHARIIEEMKLIHISEVSALKSEKARILASSLEVSQETGITKEMSRENSMLRAQLKALTNELQETRMKSEHEKSVLDQEGRIIKKQLSEATASFRRTEIELDSLRNQLANNQKELANWNTENANLRFQNNELDRTNRSLQNRLDELTQKAKVDLTQLKLEAAKQKGDIERQNELLLAKTDELEYQLRLAGTKCGQLETQLQQREISIARREASIKETEWDRIQKLENEKAELATEIAMLQSANRDEKNSISSKILELENRAKKAEMDEAAAVRNGDSARQKLDSTMTELKSIKANLNEAKNKIVQQEAELDECYNRLAVAELAKKDKNDSQQQIKQLTRQLDELAQHQERQSADLEAQWTTDRQRSQQRIKELEQELSQSLEKTRLLQEELRRKNKKHCNYFNKQKKQLQIVTALKEELGAQNEILKRNVPAEDYQKLSRQLKDLRRRHQEYGHIISQHSYGLPSSNETGALASGNEARYEKNLEQLKKRLEMLDEKQQQQLPEVLQLHESEKGDMEKDESTYGPCGDNV